jgi:hypothetical protein
MRYREQEIKPGGSPVRSTTAADEKDLNTGTQNPKSKRYKWILLFALLIMIFSIAQIIILLSSTGVQYPVDIPVSVSAEPSENRVKNIEDVRGELEAVKESLDEAELDADFNDAEQAEAEQVEIEQVDKANFFGIDMPVSSATAIAVVEESLTKDEALTESPGKESLVIEPAALKPVVTVQQDKQIDTSVTVEAAVREPDFIKYDEKGNELSDDSENWVCVRDSATGLMWEVKAQDDTLRDSDNLYSWFHPEREQAAGESGGGRCKGDASCDTHAYVEALNEKNFCGHDDWSLPTREQMQTLVDLRDSSTDVKINSRYFPNTMPSWYWTSSDEQADKERAWYVLFRNGFALRDLKERPKHIRLVRKNNSTERL